MNIAKLFVLASVCFSISSAQAMGSTFSDGSHNYPETGEYARIKLSKINDNGEMYVLNPIPLPEFQTLEKNDILSVVPSSIEFSDANDEFVFNVLATAKLFMHVRVHHAEKFMLPQRFVNLTEDEFKKECILFKNLCSLTLGNLNLGVKKDKIRKVVDRNIKKIIEQLGGNPDLYNTADQDKEIINDIAEKWVEMFAPEHDQERKNIVSKMLAEYLNEITK